MNPLLVIPQPRDIPQFTKHFYGDMACMEYDRLIIKYTRHNVAYHKAREIFLNHPEYTHYIYGTDDIIFDESDLNWMIADYQHHLRDQGLENVVMAADMNLDMENHYLRGFSLSRYKLPRIENNGTGSIITMDMYHFADLRDEEVKREIGTYYLVRCSWSALPLAIIPRRVIELTTFNNELEYVNSEIDSIHGCCIDMIFAIECAKHDIPIYTDISVGVTHLKPSVAKNLWLKEYSKVDIQPPEWYFLKRGTDERIDLPID